MGMKAASSTSAAAEQDLLKWSGGDLATISASSLWSISNAMVSEQSLSLSLFNGGHDAS
jgi:hypothetical protein